MDKDRAKKSEEVFEDTRRTLGSYTRIVMGGGFIGEVYVPNRTGQK